MPLIKQDENNSSISYTIDTPEEAKKKIDVQNELNAQSAIEERKRSLLSQIKYLEGKIYYSQLDGATEFVNKKMEERLALKEQLRNL